MSVAPAVNENGPIVSFRSLTKIYGGNYALSGVDLDLRAAETVGLVGKNGAGKSTLIKVLAGAVKPDSGTVLIDGRAVHLRGPHDSAGYGLAFVHQDLSIGLVPKLSVAENVGLGLGYPRILGAFYDSRKQAVRAAEVLDRLGVRLDVRAQVGTLSVVQQRLVTIARALKQNARLIVLDEPTTSLTPAEIDHLYEVIDRLHEAGVAVIYVSHRLPEVFRLAQRIVIMRDGRVVEDVSAHHLDEPALIRQIAGGSTSREGRSRPPADGDEILRLEGLSSPPLVRDMSFSLRAGEVVGIAGLVGAGRTETVRAIFGADRPTAGNIFVHGRPVSLKSPRDALRHNIALLPENRMAHGMVPSFSIRSNISLPTLARHRGRLATWLPFPSRRRECETAHKYMSRLQIKAAGPEQRSSALSGGNQQKVIVGKWLHYGADILLFDEPTQGIDVLGKEDIYEVMTSLAQQGAGVLFISSEFAEFERVCHRVLVMREGRIVDELVGDEISEDRILGSCFSTPSNAGSGQRREGAG